MTHTHHTHKGSFDRPRQKAAPRPDTRQSGSATSTVEPPVHDDLLADTVPEADDHREYGELVTSLMVVWDASKPQVERKMEQYSLKQCETIIREFWRARR